MYPVSDAFRTAMHRPVQRMRLRGTLRLAARTVSFEEKHVLKNSFTLSNACSGSDNVEIGTVYTAELNVTFCGLGLSRRSLEDGVITPKLYLQTDDGWEPVPLGVFTVSEADWTSEGVEVTAYDNMTKFDKSASIKASNGEPYDFLVLACKACGVELGITREEVQGFANGSETLSLYAENDIETWRDLVSWIAQTTGTFATIDRSGALTLRAYGTEAADTIDDTERITGAKFSDFTTRYTGISCVNISDQTTSYYGLAEDDGLTYNLGSNPFMQYGLDATLEAQRRAVLEALSVIAYVPMEVSMIGSPAYDLGDVIRFTGGISGESLGCITQYDWTYGGAYQIMGVGQNPALASARSKTDKDISGLLSQASQEDAMHYYDYINAEAYHIADGDTAEIIHFHYVTTKQTHIDFHAEVRYVLATTEVTDDEALTISEGDGVLKVSYNLNGEDITDYYPVETRPDGEHLLHLMYVWSATANITGTFSVKLTLTGGEAWIAVGECRAYIAGQGLAGDETWDGTISVEDSVEPVSVAGLIGIFTADVSGVADETENYDLSDLIAAVDMSTVIGGFTETFGGIAHTCRFDPASTDAEMEKENVTTADSYWSVNSGSSYGTLTTPDTETGTVCRVTCNKSGDVGFVVSFDGGTTWEAYGDGWYEPEEITGVYGMTESVLRSISQDVWMEKLSGSLTVRAILAEGSRIYDICIWEEDYQT